MREITFCGVTSSSLGIKVDEQVPHGIPASRLNVVGDIAGRDGYVLTGLNSADSTTVTVTMFCQNLDVMGKAWAWLRPGQRGRLILSDDPNHAYDAVLRNAVPVRLYTYSTYTIEAAFDVQPYRVRIPEATAIQVTSSGTLVANPGNMEAKPVITVEGSGDVTIAVGGHAVDVEGLDGKIRIDTEAYTASDEGMEINLMASVTGDVGKLTIPPEGAAISWTGIVTQVTVLPRWRDW